ncbi:MAG: TIGR03067 domain-containing protein [Gemmataceae bacterium]|nr:TIGR03067 domain-containing protein [Gemmataceae bacterium]
MGLTKLFGLFAALVPSQIEPPSARELAAHQELIKLQGAWQFESLEEDGEKTMPEELKGRTLFFGADTFFIRANNKILQMGQVKLDPTKSPKTFNAVVKQGQNRGEVMLGIFALEGDTLRLCYDALGQERPKEFKTKPGANLLLVVCKRVRSKIDEPDLSGTYRAESIDIDGSKQTAEAVFERRGDAYFVTYRRGKAIGYVGIGIRKGNVFSMSWVSQGQAGISVYQIESGPRLTGHYTQLGGPGLLGQETLTRFEKDL